MRARLTGVSILLFAAQAVAAGLPCPTVLRAGVSDLGYAAYQENGQLRGTSVDIIAELGRRTGCRFQVDWYPRSRLYLQYEAGRIDLAMASSRNEERDHYGRFIPYTYTTFELLLEHQKDSGHYTSLADFAERGSGRLNVTRGIYYPPEVEAQFERLRLSGRLEYVNDYDIVFKKISAGRAEGTLAPPVISLLHMQRYGLAARMAAMPVAETPRRLIGVYAARATVPEPLYHALAGVLHDMVVDGTVQKIHARHLGAEVSKRIYAGGIGEILDALKP
ncbi:substrate-binding periplasmic protein [Oxalobacteraceae bacterium A2-2]